MFAVLLPMVPFVLWHDELIFNHSEEEWAYFFPAARTGRIDRPSDRGLFSSRQLLSVAPYVSA
jgi:hypothetical protein